jgi:hypothetical protein
MRGISLGKLCLLGLVTICPTGTPHVSWRTQKELNENHSNWITCTSASEGVQ